MLCDYVLDYTEFVRLLHTENVASWEIGDGVGLASVITDLPNSFMQVAFYDLRMRKYVCEELNKEAFMRGASRITIFNRVDRADARAVLMDIGFEREGVMRQAFKWPMVSRDRYTDVEIWGLAWRG